ncbi:MULTISPECIES: SAV_2336 N-terminal domain-related protein [unclassified Moorena]|uniref:SAV_2336 N-terminal domain-related protein n=1 Tax=unclassified Moorena TaxID=2683338 RepID=UPI0025FDED67|nr:MULTISPECIES: SAV_2336 N-terminal domain-related protein [unclassified Moorena]
MLEEAIAILQQAGFDLTAREIAEIFWLAVHLDESIDESEPSTLSKDQSQQPPNKNPDIQPDPKKSSSPGVKKPGADVSLRSSKPKKTKESREAIPIKVPAAVALRNTLALGRALRPLMGKVPSATETILDVEATVYQIAESKIWLPVLKPASERWLELALVVEKTSSTAVWKQTITELQHLVKHHGAFRDVRTWELRITDTKVNLFSQTSTGRYDSTPYPPEVLIDPKKQRLILLVSDCISVAWRIQLIHRVLELWGRNGLLTILQLLPERLWERTALASEIPVQLHSFSPGVVNSQFIVKPWDEDDIGLLSEVGNSTQNKSSSVSVPVVTLEPYPLLAWSQVIAGQGNVTTVGFNFDVSQDPQPQKRAVDGEASQPQLEAPALVSRFRATASPMARRLAGLMAASPVISLPVVQLIQQTLLPKSAQIHVAEVFMSGLLQSITPVDQNSNPDYIEYEFKPGVRELLVDSVPISKTLSVNEKVSEFLADQLGLSVKDFEARLLTPATASNDGLEEKIRPFARLKAQVLGRLGGEYARLAEQLLISETPRSANPSSQFIKLAGQQYQQLTDALVDAFPSKSRLAELVEYKFSKNLDSIAMGDDLKEIVFKLIKAAQAEGWVDKLIAGARESSPDNSALLAFAQELNLAIAMPQPDSGAETGSSTHILHLSDLHIITPEQATLWSNQLAQDLSYELQIPHLDALILSGDIANYSTAEEYQAAQQFLDHLREDFPLDPKQIVLVPGNHDLNWKLAKQAYQFWDLEDYDGELKEGHYIKINDEVIKVRDEAKYQQRFANFSKFYQAIKAQPYPLEYDQQGIIDYLPEQNLLILGLNSAWELDHHFKTRASIHSGALTNALTQIRRNPDYDKCMKIAVWHHPLNSDGSDRITDKGFIYQLAVAGFRFFLHGHIHKAESHLFRYDFSPGGRKLDGICAGTFGAPTFELRSAYPWQYNLLKINDKQLTVHSRRREEENGAWKPDSRWSQGPGQSALDYYCIEL